MVECTALEMRHACKGIVGSNPTLSAIAVPLNSPLIGHCDWALYLAMYQEIQCIFTGQLANFDFRFVSPGI